MCLKSYDLPNATVGSTVNFTPENPRKNVAYIVIYDNGLRRFCPCLADSNGLLQAHGVDVSVPLCSAEELMAKGHLDQPNVSRRVVEPCRKCVPQCMGRDGLGDPGFLAPAGNDPLDLSARQSVAGPCPEDRLCHICPTCKRSDPPADLLTRNELLWFAAFGAAERHPAAVEVDVSNVQRDGLAQSASRCEHEQNQRAVALGPPASQRHPGNPCNLPLIEHIRRK